MSKPPVITGAVRRDETILRLGGNGDNWYMSWAADDTQFTSLCDGLGLPGVALDPRNSRLLRIVGSPPAITFADVPGYPALPDYPFLPEPDTKTRYYGFGTLAVEGRVYQYLSTWNRVPRADPDLRFVGAKLIYSPDGGKTWHNQDRSTPVTWEPWDARSRETMVFFNEPQGAFSLLSILQMGRDYSANTDGYVYVYSPNGNAEGSMNQLVMFRVPKDRVLDRSAYEYFHRRKADGSASWTPNIDERGIVDTFPSGFVNTLAHPYAWQPSVTYNSPLGVYMMSTWGDGTAPDGMWFGKPSYLGIWVSQNPWGPWKQIHEDHTWTPGGDQAARCYQPQISPKWIAEDGKSFWLVWTDFQQIGGDPWASEGFERVKKNASIPDYYEYLREFMPNYSFNLQRVDLKIS